MEKAATDVYSFRKLRENGFTYVDKTAMLLSLCDLSIGTQFFLARPRRFGKSLLVSTLHCLFEGRRELFRGLAIEPNWDWTKSWPVIHLDMGTAQSETVAELREFFFKLLASEAERLGVALRESTLPSGFRQVGENRKYTLGFPNLEVENSFLTCLAPVYAGLADMQSVNYQLTAQEALLAGDVDRFVKMLKNFFANIPYDLTDRQNEQMWQTIVYVILKAIGVAVSAEVMTNEGRIDRLGDGLTCRAVGAVPGR